MIIDHYNFIPWYQLAYNRIYYIICHIIIVKKNYKTEINHMVFPYPNIIRINIRLYLTSSLSQSSVLSASVPKFSFSNLTDNS